MPRSFSVTIHRAMNAPQTANAILALIEITHSTFSALRFVNNVENVTSNGHVYTAFPFEVQLPPDSTEQRPVLRVVAANVGRELIDEIRTLAGARERMKATVSIIISSEPNSPIVSYPDFEIVNVGYGAATLTFDLTLEGTLTEAFPYHSQTPSTVPGIF